jgi:hypothetical protein
MNQKQTQYIGRFGGLEGPARKTSRPQAALEGVFAGVILLWGVYMVACMFGLPVYLERLFKD